MPRSTYPGAPLHRFRSPIHDAVVPSLGLAKSYGLGAYAAPIEEHRRALSQLVALQVELRAIQSVTSGIFMSSESETWKATTTVYTMLRRIARSDGDLAHLLQPIVTKYFARRKRRAPEAPAAEQAAATAPSAKKRARAKR
jgi:hypothetical protein